jgi:Rrf2 family iron-sulfur cluster assembly transcriptional regulator
MTIPEIAASENLSPAYAGKLLTVLRQAGLVEAERGRAGGYRLTAPPSEIRLGEALLALGEPLFEGDAYCERHAGPESGGPCIHRGGCGLRGLWEALEQWMRHILDQVTLQDVLSGDLPIVQQLKAGLPPEEKLLPLGTPG